MTSPEAETVSAGRAVAADAAVEEELERETALGVEGSVTVDWVEPAGAAAEGPNDKVETEPWLQPDRPSTPTPIPRQTLTATAPRTDRRRASRFMSFGNLIRMLMGILADLWAGVRPKAAPKGCPRWTGAGQEVNLLA